MVKPGTDDVLTILGILDQVYSRQQGRFTVIRRQITRDTKPTMTNFGNNPLFSRIQRHIAILFQTPEGSTTWPTFYKICKAKSTGQYSALPYVATLLNCMLWTFYGSGAVAGLVFVVSINVAGLIMEGCYVTIHLLLGTHNSRKTISTLLAVISIFYGALVSVVLVVVKSKDSRAEVVGSVCVIIGVLMYAAPLSVMKEVIRSQSVASMPFLLSFACFCNGLIWTTYGIMKENMFIYIPNGLGTLLTLAQLVLWCIYYKKCVLKSSERDTANLSGHHAVDVDKLTKQPSAGARLDLAADSDLIREPKKDFNENDTALTALCLNPY